MAALLTVALTLSALTPPAVHPQMAGCPAAIIEVFGEHADDACYVAFRESTWRKGATGRLGERGYFQIHPVHSDSTYDEYGNALAAYRLSNGGVNWCTHWRWTC